MASGREQGRPEDPGSERIVRTATEARQGEIILGRVGRWIWIGSFALLMVVGLAFAMW